MLLGFCITVLIILVYVSAYLAHIDSWAGFPTALITALIGWCMYDGILFDVLKEFKHSD